MNRKDWRGDNKSRVFVCFSLRGDKSMVLMSNFFANGKTYPGAFKFIIEMKTFKNAEELF